MSDKRRHKGKSYVRRSKQLSHRNNAYNVKNRVDEVMNLRLEGKTFDDIEDILRIKYNTPYYTAKKYFNDAKKRINELLDNDPVHVRILHADRYEFFYKKFLEWGYDKYAMQALENVERLVGFHSRSVMFSVENLIKNKKANGDIYDYTKLEKKEREELKTLIDKCRK